MRRYNASAAGVNVVAPSATNLVATLQNHKGMRSATRAQTYGNAQAAKARPDYRHLNWLLLLLHGRELNTAGVAAPKPFTAAWVSRVTRQCWSWQTRLNPGARWSSATAPARTPTR